MKTCCSERSSVDSGNADIAFFFASASICDKGMVTQGAAVKGWYYMFPVVSMLWLWPRLKRKEEKRKSFVEAQTLYLFTKYTVLYASLWYVPMLLPWNAMPSWGPCPVSINQSGDSSRSPLAISALVRRLLGFFKMEMGMGMGWGGELPFDAVCKTHLEKTDSSI